MGNKAVLDSGPVIHLTEIDIIRALGIFSETIAPFEVIDELKKLKIMIPHKLKGVSLNGDWKDKVKLFTNQENLDLGESCAIVLCLQEKADYFLTDDLDAREVARKNHLEVHGSAGIILRAFRNKIIDKKTTIEKIKELKTKSSLFITQDLINNIIKAIEIFPRKL